MSANESERVAVLVPTELTPAKRAEFDALLQDALQVAPAAVFLNCRLLQHITSDYVHVFWSAYERCAKAGAVVKLEEPPGGLVRTLQATDLAHFFGLSEPVAGGTTAGDPGRFTDTAGVYTDHFRPEAAAIETAVERFTGFLSRLGSPKTTRFDLRTVFYEIATNIRLHARTDPAVDAECTATVGEDKIVLCFRYTGMEFDPTQHAKDMDFVAAARSGQQRGFGLAMVHRMTNGMSYVREPEGWNVLTLEKRRTVKP